MSGERNLYPTDLGEIYSDEVEHYMSRDEKTTAEAMIEIHFNLYELEESISKYRIIDRNDWTIIAGREGEYLLKEFDTYGVLIYPVNTTEDIKNAFSFRLDKIDVFREMLHKPLYWRESITVYINKTKMFTSQSLNLETFIGIDLVNNILRTKGIEFKDIDGIISIIIEIDRPLNRENLNSAIEKLSRALSLYFRIKEAQEEIARRLAIEF